MTNKNPLRLSRAAKWSDDLPHQTEAWDWLQGRLSASTVETFFEKFRNRPAEIVQQQQSNSEFTAQHPITKKILNRILALGIKLEKPKSGYMAYIVGIEGVDTDLTPNGNRLDLWNDAIGVLMVSDKGRVQLHGLYQGTVDPGKYYTRNRLNRKGAAMIPLDTIHKDIWMIGRHKDQNNCLIQIGNQVTMLRDSNADGLRNDPTRTRGFFGINFHHAKNRYSRNSVGKWSAGCAVIPLVASHQNCMKRVQSSYNIRLGNKKVSYITLDGDSL